jgi:hypothetical protein
LRTRIPLCAAALACIPALAAADVVTIAPSKDATMYNDSPDRANALGPGLYLGRNSNGFLRRALISFDIAAAVPAGSTITGVTMTLRSTRAHGSAVNVEMHRLLGDWGEAFAFVPDPGGNGTTAGPGDVTWTERFFDQSMPWATPGGDFLAATTSSVTVGSSGSNYTWPSTTGFVGDVQSMLDNPAANFGWILTGNETASGTAKRFASREYGTVSSRPILTVTYTVPAPGGAGILAGAGLLAGARRRRPR